MAGHSKSGGLLSRFTRNQLIAIGVVAVVLIGAVVGIIVATSSSPPSKPSSSGSKHVLASSLCPLTDLPAPGGKAPDRPAIAVKIGNEPGAARPQSGLNEADIVIDTPAEGFIMRYIAIFQCQNVATIGPVRSVRWIDWHVLAAYGQPILTFAGGITPDVSTVTSLKWIRPANLLAGASSAGHRITARQPPDNLYTDSAQLYGLYKSATNRPDAVFDYSSSVPSAATSASQLAINYSAGTDIEWRWDGAKNTWVHFYSASADNDALTNEQVSTTNIVVEIVGYHFGPYAESPGGSGDFQGQTVGSGTGYVLRNGKSIKVTWHRDKLSASTTFTDSSGQAVDLAPGRTWVEIVPDTTARAPGGLTITK